MVAQDVLMMQKPDTLGDSISSSVAITLDIDWAPDFAIDFTADILIDRGVPATWFVTHWSAAVERLRDHQELFELGIHPNLLAGSSHGSSEEEVLDHCLELVPDAVSVRTHGLAQSSAWLTRLITQTNILADVSLFVPGAPFLQPVQHWWERQSILRLPFFWEDDCEMEKPVPAWNLPELLDVSPGMKILNFHPIHVFLNTSDRAVYEEAKRSSARLYDARLRDLEPLVQDETGTRSIFVDAADYLALGAMGSRIRDIATAWAVRRQENTGRLIQVQS